MLTAGRMYRLSAARRSGAGSIARGSATVAVWTMVSRATGLLRVVAIGAVLGPTFLSNTFLATNGVPNLIYAAVAGPVLGLVVVPAIVRTVTGASAVDGAAAVRRLSGLLLAASGAVAVLLLPVSVVLAWALTLGVPEVERGRARVVAMVLLVLVVPQVVLYTVAALGAAVQQAKGRFALAAAAPALENVGLMLTMGAVVVLYRAGFDVAGVPFGMVVLLGGGATLSVALHAAVQAWGAARQGLAIRPARGWRVDPEVHAVAVRLRQSVWVAVLPSAGYFLLLAFAASTAGGVLLFQIAYMVYVLPTALGARAITTAALPGMSAAVQRADPAGYADGWRQAVSYSVIAGLPAMCVITVFAGPIATTLATGELRNRAAIGSLTVCIAVLGVAQLSGGLHEVGRQALFARLDGRGPQRSSAVALTVTMAGCAIALLLPAGTARLAGLCLTVLLADTAAAGTVALLVRRAIRPLPFLDHGLLGAAAVAAAAMLPVLGAGWALTPPDGDRLRGLLVIAASTAVAALAFAATLSRRARRAGTR